MHRVDLCLRRIQQVRSAAEGQQPAYLLRTRTHRMLLSIQRLVASEFELDIVTPSLLTPPPSSSGRARKIAEVCNRILLESGKLSQRSAALDERWQDGWMLLKTELDRLQVLLQSMNSAGSS
jgi:hypothetical protein